ncbi:TPA: permease prefix domain 1-containing protein [Clostridium perfringens]
MREIDSYINSLYKNFDKNSKENLEIKEVMRTHLIETVEDLKSNGYDEKESIKIALERFGEVSEIREELETVVEKGIRPLIYTVVTSLIILSAFFIYLTIMRFDFIRLPALLIVAIPMYIGIRGGVLIYYKNRGINYYINWRKEIYKFLFSTYFIFLIGWYVFPIAIEGISNINFEYDLIPFYSFIKNINNGITPVFILKGLIIRVILFMPLGFYPIFLKEKFNNIIGCIAIGSLVYFIIPIIEFILNFGRILVPVIYIGIDYWIISIIGVLLGYLLYKLVIRKDTI